MPTTMAPLASRKCRLSCAGAKFADEMRKNIVVARWTNDRQTTAAGAEVGIAWPDVRGRGLSIR